LTNRHELELYHFDRSSAARKVRIALEEKGLEWQSHLLDTSVTRMEHFEPNYLALNPRGVVPTLVHNGQTIRESQVILEYLEDVFPEPPLRPSNPVQRALMRIWTKLADENLHVQSRTLAMCIYMRDLNSAAGKDKITAYYAAMPEHQRRQNDLTNIEYGLKSPLLGTAVACFKRTFHDIDATIANSPWLAGESYSLADITIGTYVTRLSGLGMASLWQDFSHLNDWYDRFTARPAYTAGVTVWGDSSSAQREKQAKAAFATMEALWDIS